MAGASHKKYSMSAPECGTPSATCGWQPSACRPASRQLCAHSSAFHSWTPCVDVSVLSAAPQAGLTPAGGASWACDLQACLIGADCWPHVPVAPAAGTSLRLPVGGAAVPHLLPFSLARNGHVHNFTGAAIGSWVPP